MPTARPESSVWAARRMALVLGVVVALPAAAARAQAPPDMLNTRHNLAVSGPGPVRALAETRICVFCHTPHNATPRSPLWNRELTPQVYTVYTSPTLRAGPLPQPSGPTKLCLSCHDGTIAMGAVVNPAGGIAMAGGDTLPPGSLANFGLDLSGHHPVSFSYQSALPNAELAPAPPPDLVYGGVDEVHCSTCHDPHNDTHGKFLLKDNRFSALCLRCHDIAGWSSSLHATSTASVVGILPRPPKTWPTYTQLDEWGCEVCHTPHFAPTAEQLLNFTDDPPEPFACTSAGCHAEAQPPVHGAAAATATALAGRIVRAPGRMVDIDRQVRKMSAHHITPAAQRVSARAAGPAVTSVACADCHNPHAIGDAPAEAPYASGLLRGVSGVDRNGVPVRAAQYEYEVCFKCHADNAPDLAHVPRVLTVTNVRLAFDPINPSYHPVVAMGRNLNVPSIPSPYAPTLSPAAVIYCTDCHADDEGGSRGPHGSAFAPILRERYETTGPATESYETYALCYRCHDRTSIVRDASFQRKTFATTASGGGHSGHLAAGASCATCHDPHGVYDVGLAGSLGTGSHTHLINFDTRIVGPRTGAQYPVFTDGGTFAGSCDLVCHGVDHDGASYP